MVEAREYSLIASHNFYNIQKISETNTILEEESDRNSRTDIPKKAIYRLSIYHRCLQKLSANGQETVSSETLAKAAGVKPAQLRKDLGYIGQFGTRGLGYPVELLIATIREALGREQLQPVILVGAGNLGSALLRYQGFQTPTAS